MRDGTDETLSIQARESYSGPTAGYLFLRVWREDQGYSIMAFDDAGNLAAMAFGKKNAQAWDNIHAALREKGIDSQG
jgi:hypothetical protein